MNTIQTIIQPYRLEHQYGIDLLLQEIAAEYSENFFSPAAQKISDVFNLQDRYYWVAISGHQVIGTVGIVVIPKRFAVLKSMFLARDYRSSELQIAARLLQTAIEKALKENCSHLYLGTMTQFKAAQKFYTKNGFLHVLESDLPLDYPPNSIDTVFYKKKIR